MTAEGGAPATRRQISERLRGRLSESMFVCITGLRTGNGPGGGGGLQVRKRFERVHVPCLERMIVAADRKLTIGGADNAR